MAGRQRARAAASSYLPMTAVLFLWVFSCGHVEASLDFANMTALEKHVEFFDRNKDGIITAPELFEGYVAIGCDAAFARSSAASISAGVGAITSPADAPLPHSTIYIEYIHKAIHGSDTGAYDAKGRFVPAKFEEIFTKYAKVRPDALTYEEIEEMILANRDSLDPSSWSSPVGEWGLIYKLASDKQGFLSKALQEAYMMAACFTSWRNRGRLQEVICDGVQHSVRCNEHNTKHESVLGN